MKTNEVVVGDLHLWRCRWGRISTKPVKVINLGDGNIKVVGSCLTAQKRDDWNESYHDTYAEAVSHLLVNTQRDVKEAKKKFDGAKRRLKSAQSKWIDELRCIAERKKLSHGHREPA